jgi:hypothetical protein
MIGAGRRGRGILLGSTSRRGRMWSNRRRECIRRGRRASCALLWFGGIRGPVGLLATGLWDRCGGGTYIGRGGGALEVRLNGAVLLVEEGHVGDKVLDDVHVWERVDAGFLGCLCGNAA